MKWWFAQFALSLALLALTSPLPAADPAAVSARAKADRLQDDKVPAGSTLMFSQHELDALVRTELAEEAQLGIHDSKVVLGTGTFELSAIVDFRKVAESGGREINSMLAKLLEGERPLRLAATLDGKAGFATLRLTTVEISGIPVSGIVLDLVVRVVILPLFPESKINEPFVMGHGVETLDIRGGAAYLAMKK